MLEAKVDRERLVEDLGHVMMPDADHVPGGAFSAAFDSASAIATPARWMSFSEGFLDSTNFAAAT